MSAFSPAAFSELAFSLDAFDFGAFNVSFSSSAFSKDVAFSSSAFSFDGTVISTIRPGRVYKGLYPYWKTRKKPYWEIDEDLDGEQFLAMLGIEL